MCGPQCVTDESWGNAENGRSGRSFAKVSKSYMVAEGSLIGNK